MLGESCWPAFRDRVQAQYNYSVCTRSHSHSGRRPCIPCITRTTTLVTMQVYTCHQTMVDGLHRGKLEECAAERERLCVRPYCTPRQVVLWHGAAGGVSPAPTVRHYPETHPMTHVPMASSSSGPGKRSASRKRQPLLRQRRTVHLNRALGQARPASSRAPGPSWYCSVARVAASQSCGARSSQRARPAVGYRWRRSTRASRRGETGR